MGTMYMCALLKPSTASLPLTVKQDIMLKCAEFASHRETRHNVEMR